jgi:KUP system potassium uptake protein
MVPKPLRSLDQNTPALLQLFWDRYGLLPRNLLFVEVLHQKVPYVHKNRYRVTTFDRDPDHPERGSVLSVAISFGFFEDPNVEKVLADLAQHHEIDLPGDPHLWSVHASQENLLPSRRTPLRRRIMFRVFSMLRHLSQPAYYYYGLGDEVQLSVEIMPVRMR